MSLIYKAYLNHKDALSRFLRRYYKRAEDVEDAAQEAFLRAFAMEARKEIRAPKQFLFQVAKHYALSDIAKKSNSTTTYLADFESQTVLRNESQVSADEQLVGREKLSLLVEAVALLPPQCQRVFLMRKFDGLKVKDIAKRLDLSVSSVEKHIAVGLVKCADYLAARGYTVAAAGKRPPEKAKLEAGGRIRTFVKPPYE